MTEYKPVNRLLVGLTLVVLLFLEGMSEFPAPEHLDQTEALGASVVLVIISPILVLWFKAVWNNVMPRITGWREITFWEAVGLSAIVALVMG